jgi:manganese/zinc/iron transport system substrate-binding protein
MLTRLGAALSILLTSATIAAAQLTVVATTGMIADTARQIGGDHVQVRALMGPGVDPHAFRQTRSDIVAMTRADLVLWHGLYLEAQMEEFFEDLSRRRTVVAVAEGLPRDLLLAHEDYDNRYDPHVWMVPDLWQNVAHTIRDALIAADPDQADAYSTNTETFLAELETVSVYSAGVLATVPPDQRVLLTAHDAFNYFGNAYGFEVLGIQGISTESEAGLARIADLVDLLVTRNIRAVFVESSVSDRNIRALIEGAASRGHEVHIGGELFSDAMGEPGSYEGTYIGMIDHNVTTITRSLGGSAPERGMTGQLSAGM